MSENNSFASGPGRWLRYRPEMLQHRWLWAGVGLVVLVIIGSITSPVTGEPAKHARVAGAGKTVIESGAPGPTPETSPLPVTTLLAFHADAQGGDFECLAFLPSHPAGAGSGEFDQNVMYVTGKVTSLEIGNGAATLRGTATVTGLGAGHDVPFIALVHPGGPGITVRLDISGLTFNEILVEGHINID